LKIKSQNLFTKNYLFILLINLFAYLGFYLLVPTLPAYAKQIGGSSLEASLVVSGFSITSLIFRFFAGDLCTIIGKKFLIALGLAILAFSTLFYMFMPIQGIIAFRFVQGMGWGISSTTIATVVSEIVPTERRGEGMGYYSLSMIISMSIAPVVAIMVMNVYKFDAIAIASISFVFISILSLLGLKISKSKITPSKKRKIKLSELIEKRAVFPSFLCLLLSITLCGIMSYIMLYGNEIKMNIIWIYFVGHVVAILITRPFVGKLFDKIGHAVVILPGAVSMIVGLVLLSFVHSVFLLIIASIFYGLGYGAVQPSLQTWAVNRSPSHRKGAANGTFLSSLDLGFTFGSIILTFVAEAKSYAFMYRFSALFMVLFLVIYGVYLIKNINQKVDTQFIEEAM
jgi:MFS family permease